MNHRVPRTPRPVSQRLYAGCIAGLKGTQARIIEFWQQDAFWWSVAWALRQLGNIKRDRTDTEICCRVRDRFLVTLAAATNAQFAEYWKNWCPV